jgi:hypothetical protein
MRAQSTGPVLSTVFVDYDNIYLSLKRKSEEAAKRFAKDAGLWLREIESGRLIRATNGSSFAMPRRIAMVRCYGNPVPRRNANDNSTDMNSFPFVRHHFLRAGFEVIDCPPLTAQLKNSADIRMVMDVRDVLNHDTQFDEFIILSGDADFTPVLHRLRAHARRTVVFANDHTAAPYTAISDGEVRDVDLMTLLLEGRLPGDSEARSPGELRAASSAELEVMRKDIVAEVVGSVRAAGQPMPLEALADRAVRALGHDKTVGSAWGGAGSFRDLLSRGLPGDVRLSDQPPYYVFDASRQIASDVESRPDPRHEPRQEPRQEPRERRVEYRDTRYDARPEPRPEAMRETRAEAPRYDRVPVPRSAPAGAGGPGSTRTPVSGLPQRSVQQPAGAMQGGYGSPQAPMAPAPQHELAHEPAYDMAPQPRQPQGGTQKPRAAENATQLQQSIARIHDACQAPPLSPPEYRVLFEVMAEEINTNNLSGVQALVNIAQRALEMGLEVSHDDVRFVLEVVSEADPWFEQGASATLFASRFRNFVVARCRSQGLNLSADEIDLIDAWFGAPVPAQRPAPSYGQATAQQAAPMPAPQSAPADRWGNLDEGRQHVAANRAPSPSGLGAEQDEEFPRIVRSRLRG